jgi:hypothetical protein
MSVIENKKKINKGISKEWAIDFNYEETKKKNMMNEKNIYQEKNVNQFYSQVIQIQDVLKCLEL